MKTCGRSPDRPYLHRNDFHDIIIVEDINLNKKTSYIVKIAMLSAIAFLLMYVEFPLPFVPPWLKFDISDFPAVLGAFALGPLGGVIIQAVKVLLFFLFRGSMSGGIGELANFLIGAAMVLVVGLIYKYKKDRSGATVSLVVGSLASAAAAGILNYFLLIPAFVSIGLISMEALVAICSAITPAADSVEMYVFIFAIPFTFAKMFITSLIVFLTYKRLSPLLHRQ